LRIIRRISFATSHHSLFTRSHRILATVADVEDVEPVLEEGTEDVEMEGGGDEAAARALTELEPEVTTRVTFLDYLKSPMVQIAVGSGALATTLAAHEAILIKSPWFKEQVATLSGKRNIDLPEDDLDAVGSVLEYLYNGEYFPKRLSSNKDSALEHDPTVPSPDNEGVALLRHARVYTLAEKFGLPALKSLAHAKIHRTNSTARGEIAYARYVYKETGPEDTTIRKPVAAFWATRSHVLRHEAEAEFRSMCLEFPQFGFDVLSLVLDQKERGRGGTEGVAGTPVVHTGRKRQRQSQG